MEFKDDVRIARRKMITARILYVSGCIIMVASFAFLKVHFAIAWGLIVVMAVTLFLYQHKVRSDLVKGDWRRRGR